MCSQFGNIPPIALQETLHIFVTERKSIPLRISMAAPPRWHQDAVLEVGTLILLA